MCRCIYMYGCALYGHGQTTRVRMNITRCNYNTHTCIYVYIYIHVHTYEHVCKWCNSNVLCSYMCVCARIWMCTCMHYYKIISIPRQTLITPVGRNHKPIHGYFILHQPNKVLFNKQPKTGYHYYSIINTQWHNSDFIWHMFHNIIKSLVTVLTSQLITRLIMSVPVLYHQLNQILELDWNYWCLQVLIKRLKNG